MGLSQKLVLKQGQSLVMTPQLQQAIKLLQMSSAELQEFVEAEIEKNPLLEREEYAPGKAATSDDRPSAVDKVFATGNSVDEGAGFLHSQSSAGSSDGQSLYRDTAWSSLRSAGHLSLDGDDLDFTANLARDITLAEHLTNQLHLHFENAVDRLIGQHLIGMVNEAGYLSGDAMSIAETLGATQQHIEKVLAVLKTFEPTGVFARDLAECLKLQLEERGRLDAAMESLIGNLDLVARRDYQGLRQRCGVDLDELQHMLAELRTLNPKPGHAYGSEPVSPVVPDILVRHAPDGSWIIELNSETLPRVLMNNRYMAKVSSQAAREEDKLFLAGCHAQATWLIRSLDQRANTVLKVAREIVRLQDGFLVHGVQHLKPITLKTVADAIEMHESTVSRVTTNKYMATPRGVFELKYFFTNAIPSAGGEGDMRSSESVRHRVKEMIAGETAERILSDDDIVDALRGEGIEIARRTVAKYRESLGILSSIQRRREARLKG
jgi:RNA polymerase sigma-54 factor